MLFARTTSLALALLFVSIARPVEPGLPSKTAIWTTSSRAIGAKYPDPKFRNPDYLAAKFLGPQERRMLKDHQLDALDLDFDAALKRLAFPAHVTAMFIRTRHIDRAFDESLREGVSQIVILGAGFDSRGYRFQGRLDGVCFMEVDYGPTQEYKKLRVNEVLGKVRNHVRYVSMDFTKDDLLIQLRKGGYSEVHKTLFVWEGVTMYLPQSAVEATLRFVRDHSAPGSTIVFDYALSNYPAINNPNTLVARWGEPMIFGFPGGSASEFVRKAGLTVISDYKQSELFKGYATRADGTSPLPPLVGAFADSTGICYARVPAKR